MLNTAVWGLVGYGVAGCFVMLQVEGQFSAKSLPKTPLYTRDQGVGGHWVWTSLANPIKLPLETGES